MNRREFVYVASAALIPVGKAAAATKKYDLIIKGGRVMDPAEFVAIRKRFPSIVHRRKRGRVSGFMA